MTYVEDRVAQARAEGFARGHAEGVRVGHAEGVKVGLSQALGHLRPVIAAMEEGAYNAEAEVFVFPLPERRQR